MKTWTDTNPFISASVFKVLKRIDEINNKYKKVIETTEKNGQNVEHLKIERDLEIDGAKTESFKQFTKSYNNILKPMEKLKSINPEVKEVPEILNKFNKVINDAIKGHKSSFDVETFLKDNNTSMGEMTRMMGSYVEEYSKIITKE